MLDLGTRRWFFAMCAAAGVLTISHLASTAFASAIPASSEDYWRYWAAWRLAFLGLDPYSGRALESIRASIPGLPPQPEVMFTPPWILPLVTPFALLPYATSRVVWFIASIALVLVSIRAVWQVYAGSPRHVAVALVLSFSFFPTLLMLRQGQVNPWVLAGVAGFLHWTERRRNDLLAGASLVLAAVKPQLFIALWIAGLLWALHHRRWRLLAAAVGVLAAATAVVMARAPQVLSQFANVYATGAPARWATPTIGYYLRLRFGADAFWLQFLAPALVAAWSIWYWVRNRYDWAWTRTVPALLLASVLGSAYSWTYDQVVLLVPILAATASAFRNGISRKTMALVAALPVLTVFTAVVHRFHPDGFFIWLAPVWATWWWIMTRASSDGDTATLPQPT